ncbi:MULTISPECIES: magnesium transporter protection protein MgtU [Limnobaculum]
MKHAKKRFEKVFLHMVIIAVIIILLTIWIR